MVLFWKRLHQLQFGCTNLCQINQSLGVLRALTADNTCGFWLGKVKRKIIANPGILWTNAPNSKSIICVFFNMFDRMSHDSCQLPATSQCTVVASWWDIGESQLTKRELMFAAHLLPNIAERFLLIYVIKMIHVIWTINGSHKIRPRIFFDQNTWCHHKL